MHRRGRRSARQPLRPRGAGGLASDQFHGLLQEVAGDWLTLGLPVLVSGMAGARGRWREMDYLPCPADVADEANVVASPDDAPHVSIVPGVAVFEDGRYRTWCAARGPRSSAWTPQTMRSWSVPAPTGNGSGQPTARSRISVPL